MTWDEQAQVAEFFHRPDAAKPLYGSVERKGPFWGKVNWQHRFLSSADPNQYYFKPDGSANVNNTAGIRAATEHLRSLQWSEPGALSKDYIGQYQLYGDGNGVQGGTFPNVTKIVPGRPGPGQGRLRQVPPLRRACRAGSSTASSSAGTRSTTTSPTA